MGMEQRKFLDQYQLDPFKGSRDIQFLKTCNQKLQHKIRDLDLKDSERVGMVQY